MRGSKTLNLAGRSRSVNRCCNEIRSQSYILSLRLMLLEITSLGQDEPDQDDQSDTRLMERISWSQRLGRRRKLIYSWTRRASPGQVAIHDPLSDLL